MERRNYLYLAHSKLRNCSFGPELRIGELPRHLNGVSRIRRGDDVIWEKAFLSGEDNMCHSLENLEYHHFKYAQFLRPGDVHIHFFGTATCRSPIRSGRPPAMSSKSACRNSAPRCATVLPWRQRPSHPER